MTLPVALSGTDVIGQAKTGTGKTLGFGLPLLERVTVPVDVEAGRAAPEDLTDAPQALVVVPTRELCTQVTNDLLTAGKVRNVRVTAIYGGRAYEPQVEALKKGVDVVVGTPGRLLDLAGQKKLNLKHVKCLVLDEADEMLDLGFLPDVEKIINMLPVRRQTMLFSATMPGAVIGLARRYMSQPTHIRATAPDDQGATVANIKQFVYRAHSMDKPEMVARMLQAEGRGLAMIFCRTKRTAADIAEQLQRRGFASGAVHGDLGQGAREQALRAFRNGKVDVLVCTDVAARGIDVEGVTHVVNYQSPEDEKTYLHRIGRTGRAGAKGTAVTLVDWDDIPRWQLINKALELDFNDPPETYSTSPHLHAELGIPEGTKGVLPRSERTRAGLAAEELEDLGEPGGRNAGRGRRGGRDESRSADRERPARTPRRRRRTRGGAPVDTAASGATSTGTVATGTAEAVTAGPETDDAQAAPRTLRRRRRTRGGVPAQAPAAEAAVDAAEDTAAGTAEPAEPAAAVAAVATAESAESADAAAKPRRRRTRRSAEATAEAADLVTPEAAESTGSTQAPAPEATEATKPRRTRKATTKAETATDSAEGTEAKPKTRRTRKTTAATTTTEAPEPAEADIPAQAAQEPAITEETKPRRRTRKTAAKAETATDTAEGTEAKPKTRRTRKTTAATTTTEAPEPAEATEATKPRRTRKATTKAETATDTAEGTEAKPKTRRTRKTTAATTTTEAPEPAEATEATKPRRTRKTAAKAAKAAGADIPAQTAQEPAVTEETKPRRRTRKATTSAKAATAAAVEASEA
ncbi:DEAD/DEAH box helicase [Streptomyces poriticola]|uniref:DEAD/DEAH box helicase n=1 Tax=Streptomyces poriticola TaxID=3120506 RepID=UPI002FCDE90A